MTARESSEADGFELVGKSVLVTGGSGFIGSHVVRALEDAGARVTVADRQAFPDSTVRSVVGDLTSPGAVTAALEAGTTAVVHLAALTSVLRSVERPVETYETNVALTAALLERSRQIGVKRFALASTNAVVGDAGTGSLHEHSPLSPLTPYGATKAAAEMLMSCYSSSYGIGAVSLRFANVYGPGMDAKDSIVARLMRAAVTGAEFEIYGDGCQVRDYVYVDDVVAAILMALQSAEAKTLVIGSARSTSVLDLVDLVRQITGADMPLRFIPAKAGEMPGVSLDTGGTQALGWKPTVDLAAGLSRVWAWWTRLPAFMQGAQTASPQTASPQTASAQTSRVQTASASGGGPK